MPRPGSYFLLAMAPVWVVLASTTMSVGAYVLPQPAPAASPKTTPAPVQPDSPPPEKSGNDGQHSRPQANH